MVLSRKGVREVVRRGVDEDELRSTFDAFDAKLWGANMTTFQLDSALGQRLLGLVQGGLPESPPFATVTGGSCGDLDLTNASVKIDRNVVKIAVTIDEHPIVRLSRRHMARLEAPRNVPLQLDFSDGSKLRCEIAAETGSYNNEVYLEGHHWSRTIRGEEPVLWVGQIWSRMALRIGNLRLSSQAGRAYDGLHLKGQQEWFILQHEDHKLVGVLGPVDFEQLRDDLKCMEFTYGTPIHVGPLIGLDASGRVVGARSVGHLERSLRGRRAPVPDDLWAEESWLPHFFELLAAKVKEHGVQHLLAGLSCYVDTQVTHFDGAYLLSQVGLEAVLKQVASAEDRDVPVHDPAEWKKAAEKICSMAEVLNQFKDKEGVNKLKGAMVYAAEASPMRILQRFLKRHGVALPKYVKEEIGKRNVAAHQFFTVENYRQPDEMDRRQQMVLTVIAAVVACHIGYEGPLQGYEPDVSGERPSPAWWANRVKLSADDVRAAYVYPESPK